jgi:hypothetical protein
MSSDRVRAAMAALVCAAVVLAWQALTVRFSYAGNWTAFYCTGANFALARPHALASENIYLFGSSTGYDGQFYHYIAHDPFLRRGFHTSIDAPRFRYPRILVPGLAWLIALGRDSAVDGAYVAVIALFVALGTYWASRLALLYGRHAAWGLLFGLVPATVVSVDRFTVDVALAACCAGFAVYVKEGARWKLLAVLASAALVRETGILLIGACGVHALSQRRIKDAAWFGAAGVPAAGWWLFIRLNTAFAPLTIGSPIPLGGLVDRLVNPPSYPTSMQQMVVTVATGLDSLALAGIVAVIGWAAFRASRRAWDPLTVAVYAFAVMAVFLGHPEIWRDVYAFGRTLAPLLLLAAVDGLRTGTVMPLLAMLAVDGRILLQFAPQALNIVRGMAG